MLAAAILAAGESKRMGQPKALVPFQGSTFVEHLIAATRHARVGITRVVLGAGAEGIRAQLKIDPGWIVVNGDWPKGQLSSIHAALRSLPVGATEGILVCPVDHPLISAQLVAALIAAFDSSGKMIVLPKFRGRRGHPVIFRAASMRSYCGSCRCGGEARGVESRGGGDGGGNGGGGSDFEFE